MKPLYLFLKLLSMWTNQLSFSLKQAVVSCGVFYSTLLEMSDLCQPLCFEINWYNLKNLLWKCSKNGEMGKLRQHVYKDGKKDCLNTYWVWSKIASVSLSAFLHSWTNWKESHLTKLDFAVPELIMEPFTLVSFVTSSCSLCLF